MSSKQDPGQNFEKIKVAFVIDTLDSGLGGTEGQLLKLIDHIDPDKFETFLFCLAPSQWKVDFTSLRVLNIRVTRDPGLPAKIWSFSRILKKGRFDIVQTHFRDGNIVGSLAARFAGIDTVISTRRGEPYWKSKSGLFFLKRINTMATCFVANSMATKTRYSREEGIDPARFEVIYNGIDRKKFKSITSDERMALRDGLGLPKDAPIVGIVANYRPVKGLADFLHAGQIVSKTFPDTHFLIVGEGDGQGSLEQLAAKLDLQDRVHFLGCREDIPQLLQIMDIGVLASHSESFSNSILEYLAAGLPVVVTDVGGAREVVREDGDGYIVPPRAPDQMARRLGMLIKQGRRSGDKAGIANLESKFYLDSMVGAYEGLYSSLVTRRQRGK